MQFAVFGRDVYVVEGRGLGCKSDCLLSCCETFNLVFR